MAIRFAGYTTPGISPAHKKYLKTWLNDQEKELIPHHENMIVNDGRQDLFLHTNKGPLLVGLIPKETGYSNALATNDIKEALQECAQTISSLDKGKKSPKGYAYIEFFKDKGYDGTPQVVSRLKRTPVWNGIASPEEIRTFPAPSQKEEKDAIKIIMKQWQTKLNEMREKDMPNAWANAGFGIDNFFNRPW